MPVPEEIPRLAGKNERSVYERMILTITYALFWINKSTGQIYKYGEYESMQMAVQAYQNCRQFYAHFDPILTMVTLEDITEELQNE